MKRFLTLLSPNEFDKQCIKRFSNFGIHVDESTVVAAMSHKDLDALIVQWLWMFHNDFDLVLIGGYLVSRHDMPQYSALSHHEFVFLEIQANTIYAALVKDLCKHRFPTRLQMLSYADPLA